MAITTKAELDELIEELNSKAANLFSDFPDLYEAMDSITTNEKALEEAWNTDNGITTVKQLNKQINVLNEVLYDAQVIKDEYFDGFSYETTEVKE